MGINVQPMSKTCPRCGAPLGGENLSGNCPRCLAALLLAPDPAEAVEPSPVPVLRRLGDYELLEEIARGGMGVVFRARQAGLNREVAVKVLRDAWLATPVQVKRFLAEAANAAKLKHPNIVAVHEVGVQGGQHYFVMDLVEGKNLAELTRESPLPPRQAAQLLAKVAKAVQHAHEQGVLHRDIKPSNVLLDVRSEPHVTDFGLARPLDDESSLTLTGQVLGTPGYMAPEQAKGDDAAGPAADVYGLGALLFHLLTARAPFVAASAAETLAQVLQQEPLSPRLLNPAVPVDLAAVCLKCLVKLSRERYGSAGELAADLERFLGNESTHARPAGAMARSVRWCRRKPALAAAIAALLVVGIVGLAGILVEWRQAQRLAKEEARQRKLSERNELAARRSLYAADMNLAQHALNENNLGRAVELLERHRPMQGQKDLRGWEWRYLWQRSRSEDQATIARLPGAVMALTFTPDYNLLAGVDNFGSVRFWDSTSWHETNRLELGAAVLSMTFSPDGRFVAFGMRDNQVTVWDWRRKQQKATFGIAQEGSHGDKVAFSPDGSTLVAADRYGFLQVRNAKDFQPVRSLAAHGDLIRALAFSRDSRLLASGGNEPTVKIWDTATWEMKMTIPAEANAVMGLQFSADGKRLLTCGWEQVVKLWNLSTGQRIATFSGHTAPVYAAVFSPDGALVASASADQTVRVWETATERTVARLQGHSAEVGEVAFSQDGKTLVSGSKDGTIRLWKVPQPSSDSNFLSLPPGAFDGKLSKDGRFGAIYSPAGIAAWSALERKQLGRIGFPADQSLFNGPFAINGGVLAFRWLEGAVRIFSLDPFQEAALVPGSTISGDGTSSEPAQLALSDDGKLLAIVSRDGKAQVQDWATRTTVAHWSMRPESADLMFAPDGRVLASGHIDGTVRLWEVDGGRHLGTLKEHQVAVEALAFSPDGRLLATGDAYCLIKLWELSSQRLLVTLRPYIYGVQRLAFTPDGTRLATATGDGSIRFWDLATYQEVLTLKAHPVLSRLAFISDGETLVTGSADGLRLWQAPGITELDAPPLNAATK